MWRKVETVGEGKGAYFIRSGNPEEVKFHTRAMMRCAIDTKVNQQESSLAVTPAARRLDHEDVA
ncbi:MAG TPA: hypothetical protein VF309_03390, partial [Usitatibacter sp.]